MIVEAPNGDLLVDWFHGSGERTADDVVVRGARLKKGAQQWSAPCLLADTPGYPDTNATMFIDSEEGRPGTRDPQVDQARTLQRGVDSGKVELVTEWRHELG